MPGQRLEARIAALRHRRHFEGHGRTLEAGHGQRAQLARLDLRQHADRIAEHHAELAAQEVADGKRGAAIGHVRHLQAGLRIEQLGHPMVGRAHAGRAVVHRARLALGECNELLQRLHGQVGVHDEDVGIGGRHGDRREVLHRVVGQCLVDGGIDRDRAGLAEQQRVAVGLGLGHDVGLQGGDASRGGLGLGHDLGAEDRARAALVVDQDRLADVLAHLLRHDARDRVGAAARCIGHDQADRLGGVVGGEGAGCK